ncbi:mutator mutT protein [Lachnospiraceae bacterium KH1T2]|nr:mutator mutT protein [Lachnospiraceae bacterium KH1T2]
MNSKQEFIDIYDEERRLTGKKYERKTKLGKGEYMLYVLAILERESDGKILITQRSLDKKWAAGAWEIPGGGVLAGESSAEAVKREVKEETGLDVNSDGDCENMVYSYRNDDPEGGDNYFMDIYHFMSEFDESEISIEKSEAINYKFASIDEVIELGEKSEFLHFGRLMEALAAEDAEGIINESIEEKEVIFKADDQNFGKIEVCDGYYYGDRMRFLLVNDVPESAVYLDEKLKNELAFEYMDNFNWIDKLNSSIDKVLLIGGGGFAYPKYFLEHHPEKSMDVVEISEKIIEASEKYFGLKELKEKAGEKLRVIAEDGYEFLEKLNKYDVIINDAFIGDRTSDQRKHSAELIKKSLNDGGIYVANMVMPLKGAKAIAGNEEMRIFSEVFKYTLLVPVDEDADPYMQQNCIFFASDKPLEM